MILDCFLEPGMVARDPLYAFLPLALAGLPTAIIFGVQELLGLLSDRDQSFRKHHSISKGANQ